MEASNFFTTTAANLGTAITNASSGDIIYVKTEAVSVDQINITSKTNLIIDGQGATLTLNNGTNAAIFNISGGSRVTIRNFNFVGPNTGTYNATNKHRGIVATNNTSFIIIESSSFSGFDSQGVYVENVAGNSEEKGVIIKDCVFKDTIYDSTTDEQSGILLGVGAEYSTIRGNYFTNIPSAIRTTTANISIVDNTITMTNAADQTGTPSTTKGLIYINYGDNDGKYLISGNKINHNSYNVIPIQIYVRPDRTGASILITDNFILVNTTGYQQIRATEIDNSVIANNMLWNNGTLDASIEIIDSDNVKISGNDILYGTHGIKATASSGKTTSLYLSPNTIRNYTVADVVTGGAGIAKIYPNHQKEFIGQAFKALYSATNDVKLLLSPTSGDTGTDYSKYIRTPTVTGYTTAHVFPDGLGYSISGASGRYYSFADSDAFTFSTTDTTDTAFSLGGFFNFAPSYAPLILIGKVDSTETLSEYALSLDSDNKLVFALSDHNAALDKPFIKSSAVYTAGKHCVVGTYNGIGGASAAGGLTLYVDGVPIASPATNDTDYVAMENSTLPVTVNANSAGTQNHTGNLSQAFIVGRKLSDEEVRIYCVAGGNLGY